MKRLNRNLHRKRDGVRHKTMRILQLAPLKLQVGAMENAERDTTREAKDTRRILAQSVPLFRR